MWSMPDSSAIPGIPDKAKSGSAGAMFHPQLEGSGLTKPVVFLRPFDSLASLSCQAHNYRYLAGLLLSVYPHDENYSKMFGRRVEDPT